MWNSWVCIGRPGLSHGGLHGVVILDSAVPCRSYNYQYPSRRLGSFAEMSTETREASVCLIGCTLKELIAGTAGSSPGCSRRRPKATVSTLGKWGHSARTDFLRIDTGWIWTRQQRENTRMPMQHNIQPTTNPGEKDLAARCATDCAWAVGQKFHRIKR